MVMNELVHSICLLQPLFLLAIEFLAWFLTCHPEVCVVVDLSRLHFIRCFEFSSVEEFFTLLSLFFILAC